MNRSLAMKSILGCVVAATAACGNGSTAPSTGTSTTASQATAHRPFAPPSVNVRHLSPRQAAGRAAAAAAAADAGAGSPVPAKYRAFATAFDLDAVHVGTPGAAVALVEHGHVTFTHAYGTVATGSTTPVDENTIFRVGNMTEPLTAAAELALVDHGKATIKETLASAVPAAALSGPYAATLTMGQLLSNQSGLFDFTVNSPNPQLTQGSCATDPGSLQAFVAGTLFGQNETFAAAPGAVYAASAPNFVLAGAAIENQSGAYYTDAMKSLLFEPLGMTRTFFLPSDVKAAGNYADGAIYGTGTSLQDIPVDGYDCAAYRPYGYAFSSVLDYAKFLELLLGAGPKVLSDASVAAMEAPHVETRDLGRLGAAGYGGLSVTKGYVSQANVYYPTKTLNMTGLIGGYSSSFYAFPETGFGIVVLANFGYTTFSTSIDVAIRSFADLPPAAPLPSSTFAAPSKFAQYEGTYVDPTGTIGTMVISNTSRGLTIDFTDAATTGIQFWPQLSTVLDDSFLVTFFGYPNTLAFLPDKTGKYAYVVFNDSIVATRVAGDAGP